MTSTSNYFADLFEGEAEIGQVKIQSPPKRLTELVKVPTATVDFPPLPTLRSTNENGRWPPNYRTEPCYYGEKCRNRFDCSYYHSEAERRMAVYEDGVWVNAKYSKSLAEKKENFRQQRQAKTQALKDQGKWKTVRCIREESHFEAGCSFYHSEEDKNVEGQHLSAKKKYDSFLVGQLKKGVVLRWA